METRFQVACHGDAGLWKVANQDSACVMTAAISGEPICMAVLCDGMGSASMGEYASQRVVTDFANWFERELPLMREGELFLPRVRADWKGILTALDGEFRDCGKKRGVKFGTTATCMLFWRGNYLLLQSGDSRAYEIRWRATQLSEDQTFVNQQVKLGKMTEQEARRHARRNEVTDFIGGG